MKKATFHPNFVSLDPARLVRRVWEFSGVQYVADDVVCDAAAGDEWLYPYPGTTTYGRIWVQQRLYSSISGLSAQWAVGGAAADHLNGALYEPVWRGFASEFSWLPPYNKINARSFFGAHATYADRSSGMEVPAGTVVQVGSGVINWRAAVLEETPEPDEVVESAWPTRGHLRAFLGDVLERVTGDPPVVQQGALSLWRAPIDTGDLGDCHRFPVRKIFNHYFPDGRVVARLGGDSFLIAIFDQCPILAIDHAPAFVGPGVYIARHPIPQPERGID